MKNFFDKFLLFFLSHFQQITATALIFALLVFGGDNGPPGR